MKPKIPIDLARPLRRALGLPAWADLLLRIGALFALLFVAVMVHWVGRDGLLDTYDGEISFLDVVYFTMISVTTTGFGDIAPISNHARLVEAAIITPIRIAVIYIFVGTAYNFMIKRSWEKWRMARIQERLDDHIVVLGFGVSGSEAVHELIARGTDPADVVVIDRDAARLSDAERLGCNVIGGDATRDETLHAVRIANARAVLVSAGRDDTSVLIVLTVRHLAPDVPITAVIRADDNELLARQAGADNVINPVRFAGLLLAGSAEGRHIADYLADLASVSGRVQLVERPVLPEEIGSSLDSITTGKGLRIYREDTEIGFWEDGANRLELGDVIVEIRPSAASESVSA